MLHLFARYSYRTLILNKPSFFWTWDIRLSIDPDGDIPF